MHLYSPKIEQMILRNISVKKYWMISTLNNGPCKILLLQILAKVMKVMSFFMFLY